MLGTSRHEWGWDWRHHRRTGKKLAKLREDRCPTLWRLKVLDWCSWIEANCAMLWITEWQRPLAALRRLSEPELLRGFSRVHVEISGEEQGKISHENEQERRERRVLRVRHSNGKKITGQKKNDLYHHHNTTKYSQASLDVVPLLP